MACVTMTHAPLPTWVNLITALKCPALSEKDLSAPWRSTDDVAFWLSRSAWSLLAVAQLRQRLTQQSSITVYLPDYFCNASLVPLRSMGAQLQFYPITDQMVPDIDACRAMACRKRPDIFVLVHFFGKPAPFEGASALCSDSGAWLIEDAAHVLRPINGVGGCGDFVLYSPHKHLPIPDGAVIVVREKGPSRLAGQPSFMPLLQEVHSSLLNAHLPSYRLTGMWLVKRVLQRMGMRDWRRPATTFEITADPIFPRLEHPKMSLLARRLLSGLLGTLDNVAHLRRGNKMLWESLICKTDLIRGAIDSTTENFTPYLAGFACDDEAQAEKLFFQWQRACLPVTTWPDLPPEVSGSRDEHKNALNLRNTRVYLPIHQTLKQHQIIKCGTAVQAGKEKRNFNGK